MDEQKKNASPVLEPLLTKNDLQQFLRVSSRTLVRLIEAGELPPPLKVGCRARWRASRTGALRARVRRGPCGRAVRGRPAGG